jgi:acyl carrier protein
MRRSLLPAWDARFETVLRAALPLLPAGIDADTRLLDFGLDSLKVVSLIMALEDTLEVVLPDDELTFEAFATPGSILDLLRRVAPESAR